MTKAFIMTMVSVLCMNELAFAFLKAAFQEDAEYTLKAHT